MLTQLRNWILRSLDINLPLIKLLKGPSLESLSTELLSQIEHGDSAPASKEDSSDVTPFTIADVEGIQVLSPWLIRGRGDAEAPVRLICFHSMGVGASLFTNFLLHPPEECDILAVQSPGRENRIAEPVATNIEQLADQIVTQLAPLFDRPVVIWGHSLGGIVAWEVIHRLRERENCQPVHFVVSGTAAPHLMHKWHTREDMLRAMVADNSPEYLASLARYADPEFFKSILPLMRRDFPLFMSYRFRALAPLECPITAFAAGPDDNMVFPEEVEEWSQHTEGGFELIEVEGDHWFLNRNRDLIVAKLASIAAKLVSYACSK
jgi:surfactin synthase thioesterase subunit